MIKRRTNVMNKLKPLGIILLIFILIGLGKPVYAEDNKPYDSMVQINYGYLFEDGSFDVFASAPGIIVNDYTVLTNNFINRDFSAEISARAEGYKTLCIDPTTLQENFSLMIYTGDGKYKKVSETKTLTVNAGEFLALTCDEELKKATLFSPKKAINDKVLYAAGFDSSEMDGNSFIKSDSYLKKDIKITNEENEIIRFSLDSGKDFTGCALINGYNELYGMILETEDGEIAVSLDELENCLDKNSIIFNVADEIVPIDYTEIQSVTDAAEKAINQTEIEYTEESLEKLKSKQTEVLEIKNRENVSQEELDKASFELSETLNGLEEVPKKASHVILILITICIVLLIIAIVLYILCKKDEDFIYKLLGIKRKTNPQKSFYINNDTFIDNNTEIDTEAGLTNEAKELSNLENKPNFQGGYIYEDRRDAPKNQDGQKKNTSALSYDLRSNNEIMNIPYIIRVSTGERVLIDKNQFTVGRDINVDYKIPENIYIGKCHCWFLEVSGIWYIMDNNSSNKTLVNGIEITPNTAIQLIDKTEIVLANEKFIFRYIEDKNGQINGGADPTPDTGILESNAIFNQNTPQGVVPMLPPTQQAPVPTPPTHQPVEPVLKETVYGKFDDMEADTATDVLTSNTMPEIARVPYLLINDKKIKITTFPFSIGRGKEATYKYTNDTSVSREHIVITSENYRYYIMDNNSSNGTLLNGEPMDTLSPYILNNGDRITILNDIIEFHV